MPLPCQGLRRVSLRLRILALSLVHRCDIRNGAQKVGMLGPQHTSLRLQVLAVERFRLRVLVLRGVDASQIGH